MTSSFMRLELFGTAVGNHECFDGVPLWPQPAFQTNKVIPKGNEVNIFGALLSSGKVTLSMFYSAWAERHLYEEAAATHSVCMKGFLPPALCYQICSIEFQLTTNHVKSKPQTGCGFMRSLHSFQTNVTLFHRHLFMTSKHRTP